MTNTRGISLLPLFGTKMCLYLCTFPLSSSHVFPLGISASGPSMCWLRIIFKCTKDRDNCFTVYEFPCSVYTLQYFNVWLLDESMNISFKKEDNDTIAAWIYRVRDQVEIPSMMESQWNPSVFCHQSPVCTWVLCSFPSCIKEDTSYPLMLISLPGLCFCFLPLSQKL